MRIKEALILSILAIFFATLMQTSAAAPLEVPLPSTYLYVGPGGFSTIQEAVDAASPGDVIVVAPGIYHENVELYKENITIVSENESNPAMVVAADPGLPVFYITANNVSIILLHVTGANNFSSAILAENVNFTAVMGNFIENSTYGVNLVNCSYGQVVYNKIANNEFAGVRLFHSMVANVSCNYFWNNSLYGIYAYNVTTSWNINNFIGLSDTGIKYVHSEGYQALGNCIVNTTYGIAVSYLFYGDILENDVISNSSGNGISATHAFYLGIYNNFVKDYFKGIYVSDSAMGTIAYNYIFETEVGLSLRYSHHYSIENNTIAWSETALYLTHCNTTSVQGNALLQSCLRSIYACEVQEVLFARNQVNTSSCGFYLYFTNSCAVEENVIFNHTSGIHLYNSTYLDIHGNCLLACSIGIFAEANSSYNFIFLNVFLNNSQHALCYDSYNTWNTPEPVNYTYGDQNYTNFLGNYWDDYEGPDNNHDGIGDVPYLIEEHNADNYPLMFIP
ncbi:MAG TPA: hypothetical protein ENF82_01015, partial [Candidatus Methanomethylia archaeon]|nr:hypothetical protein [Candidatus Methanomethylicia archaeon]